MDWWPVGSRCWHMLAFHVCGPAFARCDIARSKIIYIHFGGGSFSLPAFLIIHCSLSDGAEGQTLGVADSLHHWWRTACCGTSCTYYWWEVPLSLSEAGGLVRPGNLNGSCVRRPWSCPSGLRFVSRWGSVPCPCPWGWCLPGLFFESNRTGFMALGPMIRPRRCSRRLD